MSRRKRKRGRPGRRLARDDCVAAVAASVAAYRHRKLIIKNINQLALVLGLLDEEDAIVSQKQICSFCNVRRAAVYVLGTNY